MKYFSSNVSEFSGIGNYLLNSLANLPEFSTNCKISRDPIDFMFTHPQTANVQLDIEEEEVQEKYSFFTINFKNYRIIPIAYQFSTLYKTSPPVNWTITATNDPQGEWYLIDKKYEEGLCEHLEDETYSYQCQDKVVNTFEISQNVLLGPFQYFKFTLYSNRARYNLFDIRIGGFEIYGGLYKKSESIFIKCTCKLEKQHLLYLLLTFLFQ